MNASQPPRRRRIAGESKPAVPTPPEQPQAPAERKISLAKPKLPKRQKPEAPVEPAPKQQPAPEARPLDGDVTGATVQPTRRFLRPTRMVYALLALAIAAVVFAGFGIVRGIDQWRDDNVAASREAAADAAASAAETIFTFQYNKLPEHLRASQATMTPTFAKKFKEISPALNSLAPQLKTQVKAVVQYAATTECGDRCSADKATVLVFIDQARVRTGDDQPTVFGNRITMSMVKLDDRWKVNNIKAL